MTTGEFNTWFRRHQALFPKLAEWFGALPDAKVVLDAWAKALAACELKHATDATDRMLRGTGPLVEFNDWSTLPSVVLQHCRPLGSGKQERAGDSNYVRGATLAAFRKEMSSPPPEQDAATFAEFREMVEAMEPGDLEPTKARILRALDNDTLGARSALRLLKMANEMAHAAPAGNVGDAFEAF